MTALVTSRCASPLDADGVVGQFEFSCPWFPSNNKSITWAGAYVYQHEYALTKITFLERRDMAVPKFTSSEIEGIYRLLVVLNSSLQFLIKQLEAMSTTKVLSPKYLKEMEALSQEVKITLEKKAAK
jgi:hypothetical protein